ncbi:hypothetical protein HK099_007046 [Clydaea vesicula]|uniref:Ras-GEF domain-containing protein n=1 Tax=Clydaea vesicula TaxID=447962 RepID=A0AAD5TZI1_9FUNG|nr:hypothetical protein HK099_007046 [Clydaea vesicula]
MKKLKKNSITPLPIYEKSESTSSLLDNNDLNVNTSNELLLSGSKLSIQQDTIEMKRIFDGINFSVYPVDIHLPINLKISLDGILIKCLVDPVDEQNEIFIETASILKYSYNRGKETFKFSAIKTDNVFEEYIFQVENYFELFESVGKSILYYTRCASKVDPLHLELEKLKIEKKNFSESDLNQGKDVKNVKQNLKSASALRSAETLNSPTSVVIIAVAANFPKLATQKAKSFSDLKNQDEKIARNTKTLTFPTSIYCEESAKNDKESRSNGIIYDKKPLNIFIKKSPSSPNIPRDIPDFVLRKSVSQTKVSHTSDFDFCPFDGCIKSDEFDLCPSDNSLKIEIESENSTSRSLKLKNLFKVGNSKVPQAKLRPRTISKSERPNSIFLSFEREKGQKGKALLPVSCPEVENTDNKSSSQGDSSNVMKLGRRKTGEANTLRKLLSASKLDRRKSCVSMDDENTVLDTTNTFVNRIEKVLDKFGYEELIKSNDEVVGGTIHALISLLDKNNVTELVTILLRGYNCEINEFEGKIPQYEKGPVLKLSNSHLFETNKIGIIDAALTKRLNFLKDLISQNLPDFIIALGPRNLILNYLTELEKCDIQEYYELKMLCKDIKYILEKSVIETKMVTAMNYEFYELDLKEELFSKEEVENSEKVKRVNEIIFRLMNFEFLDYSSKLYAEKLTLQDMKLFKLIKAEEFSFFIWENSCKEKYKNLDNFIYRYNQLSHWVATVICTTGDFKVSWI